MSYDLDKVIGAMASYHAVGTYSALIGGVVCKHITGGSFIQGAPFGYLLPLTGVVVNILFAKDGLVPKIFNPPGYRIVAVTLVASGIALSITACAVMNSYLLTLFGLPHPANPILFGFQVAAVGVGIPAVLVLPILGTVILIDRCLKNFRYWNDGWYYEDNIRRDAVSEGLVISQPLCTYTAVIGGLVSRHITGGSFIQGAPFGYLLPLAFLVANVFLDSGQGLITRTLEKFHIYPQWWSRPAFAALLASVGAVSVTACAVMNTYLLTHFGFPHPANPIRFGFQVAVISLGTPGSIFLAAFGGYHLKEAIMDPWRARRANNLRPRLEQD